MDISSEAVGWPPATRKGQMKMTHDVFISYSSEDSTIADAVVAALESKGILCWFAPRDIKPGKDWGEEIAKAISESALFLLIFSGSANRSQRVLDELNLAISRKTPILPFRIENLEPSGAMLLHLSSRHWLDAFIPAWESHLDSLVRSVSLLLEQDRVDAVDAAQTEVSPPVPGKVRRKIVLTAAAVLLVAAGAVFGIPKLMGLLDDSPQDLRNSTPSPTATDVEPTPSPQPTMTNTPTPEASSLGDPDNPIVWMYVPPGGYEFNEVSAAANDVVRQFQETLHGLSLKIVPAPDMSAIISALCDGNAHIGSLSAVPYLAASQQGCAEARLIWSAYSDIRVGGMIVVGSDSGISEIASLEGRTLCIPAYTSISGWVLPSLELKASIGDPESFFDQIIESGSHDQVIQDVYYGLCAAGSAYYDAREPVDLPAVMEQVIILATTTHSPNMNISFGMDMGPALTQDVVDFLLAASEADQLATLSGYSGSREGMKLIEINDYYYNEFRDLFERAGADPEDYSSIFQ